MATTCEERIEALPKASVTCTPGIMGGMPCVDGTRIPAETILACINGGDSLFDIDDGYPSLPARGIEAVVEWALENGRTVSLPVQRMSVEELGRRR